MHRPFYWLAAALSLVAVPSSAATYQRQPTITVEHYVFNLELGDTSHAIKGETAITVRFNAAGVSSVFFDLSERKPNAAGMTVAAVTEQGGAALRFMHRADRLTIQLGRPSRSGEARVFVIRYAGEPGEGMRFGTTRGGGRGIFTWNWPSHMRDWAPTLDHVSSKVTSEFVVTAPEEYTVVANGLLDSEVSLGDGRKITHWKQGVPITPWLNAIAMARFQMFDGGTHRGVPLQLWAPVGTKTDPDNGFRVARRTIDFFGDLIGPFPYEKLGGVMAPFDGSSTEHASIIFYGDGGRRDGAEPLKTRGDGIGFANTGLLAHEIAHQWFGNSVTESSWGDVWLSEAFATYFADLYAEQYQGRDAFVASLQSERVGALAAERRERDPVISSIDDAAGPDLSRVQYLKGAWVLHMLRQQIGSPTFFKGIKFYYARYKGGHATTPDLQRAMEEVSGQRLDWFFSQWLTRVESPKLAIAWHYDEAAKAVRLKIEQNQSGVPYRLPIEIGIRDEPRQSFKVEQLVLDQRSREFSISTAAAPSAVTFDPETKLLADITLIRE